MQSNITNLQRNLFFYPPPLDKHGYDKPSRSKFDARRATTRSCLIGQGSLGFSAGFLAPGRTKNRNLTGSAAFSWDLWESSAWTLRMPRIGTKLVVICRIPASLHAASVMHL